MKIIIATFFAIVLSISSYADCSGSGIWVFPSGPTINQNAIFVIDGYARSQEVILGLNKKHTIYLKSGSKRINLLVSEICVGQFELTQAVLKPEIQLEAGNEYTMYIDSLPTGERLSRYNSTSRIYEDLKYKVLGEKDITKPVLTSKPAEIDKTLIYYGCGPSIHVVFDCPVTDDSEIIVKTTVRDSTGKGTTYYLQPYSNKINVGHGMCDGPFTFDAGDKYEVEFSYMDASGNLTVWTGPPIKFTKPTKQNGDD